MAKVSSQDETCMGEVYASNERGCVAPCCTQSGLGNYIYSHTSSPFIYVKWTSEVTTISFPNLVSAGAIAMHNNANLTSVDFPVLEEISSDERQANFGFDDNPTLNTVRAPALRSLKSTSSDAYFSVKRSNISSLSMPKLESISALGAAWMEIVKNDAMEEISLPSLRSIFSNDSEAVFWAEDCPMLEKFDASALTEVLVNEQGNQCSRFPEKSDCAYLNFGGTPKVPQVAFPSLTTVGGIKIHGYLSKMSFPLVSDIKYLDISPDNCDDATTVEIHICDALVRDLQAQCTSLFTNNQNITAACNALDNASCKSFIDAECAVLMV
jgi:hypothetical protein